MKSLSFAFILLLLTSVMVYAQVTNVRVNQSGSNPQEVTVAINPINPDNLIAGANLRYVFRSFDGGRTWTQMQLPSGTWGDPSVTFDHTGRAYIGNLTQGWDAITVRYSDDGGMTWSTGFKVRGPSSDSARAGSLYNSSLQDKEWLIADMSNSPFRGNIYMTWTDFTKYGSSQPKDSSVIVFARSRDQGVTFDPFVRISDKAGDAIDSDNTMEGAVPAVGPNGEIYVAWSGPDGMYFDRSFDGGETWEKDSVLTPLAGGWNIPISGINRHNGFPVTLADLSNSPHRGNVYINWIDMRNGDPDVFVMRSTDRGDTWSDVIRVNDDSLGNRKAQFFTWATVDQHTGELLVVYYDRRMYSSDSTDVYLARSTDGGATFKNEVISEAAFIPTAMTFFGDYIGIAALNGRVRPIWTRMSNGQLSVHTALIDRTTEADKPPMIPDRTLLHSLFPNPTTLSNSPLATVKVDLAGASHITLSIHDVLGRTIEVPFTGYLPAGTYSFPIKLVSIPGTYVVEMRARETTSGKTFSGNTLLTIFK